MDKLEGKKIAIIGAGNMGQAIAQGLLRKKVIKMENLFLSNSAKSNLAAVINADIIILGVKPQAIKTVLEQIKEVVTPNQLFISIAAGVEVSSINNILGGNFSVVRVMPNLAATVGQSVSGWVKNSFVSKNQITAVKQILQAIGSEVLLKNEDKLDAVTAISGSGPAYVFYLTEMLVQSGVEIGLDKDTASKLARQTIVGSAYLLENTKKDPGILRSEVTSKGGTTEAAFKTFAKGQFDKVFLKGVKAAFKRAKQLRLK